MIRFSFIIPVYNSENTITRCVESIEKNNCDDVEIILIEDCSKDNSLDVCKKLEKKYQNVICLNNSKNRGVSYTRNKGIEKAQGEYLLFTDSDDWVDSDYVDMFRNAAENYKTDIAICGYINCDEKQNGRADEYCFKDFDLYTQIKLRPMLKKLYDDRLLQQLWNKMFIAKCVKDNNIKFDESISIGEDTRFILAYLNCCNAQTAVLINKAPYHYMRDQDGSLMFNIGYESVEEPLINLKSLYELMEYDEEKIDNLLEQDRKKQVSLYAYLILHNAGMKQKEKKRLVLALDKDNGLNLYKQNKKIYIKEKISKLIRK